MHSNDSRLRSTDLGEGRTVIMERQTEEYDHDHASTSTEVEKEFNPAKENVITSKPSDDTIASEPVDGGAVEKQITTKSANPSVNNIAAIPNGGLTAWLQVLGAFFLFFNSWVSDIAFQHYRTKTCRGHTLSRCLTSCRELSILLVPIKHTMRVVYCHRPPHRTSPGLAVSRLFFSC